MLGSKPPRTLLHQPGHVHISTKNGWGVSRNLSETPHISPLELADILFKLSRTLRVTWIWVFQAVSNSDNLAILFLSLFTLGSKLLETLPHKLGHVHFSMKNRCVFAGTFQKTYISALQLFFFSHASATDAKINVTKSDLHVNSTRYRKVAAIVLQTFDFEFSSIKVNRIIMDYRSLMGQFSLSCLRDKNSRS